MSVRLEYSSRSPRRASKAMECTGGSVWCPGTIHAGETYTVLLDASRRLVGKWCAECTKALGRW